MCCATHTPAGNSINSPCSISVTIWLIIIFLKVLRVLSTITYNNIKTYKEAIWWPNYFNALQCLRGHKQVSSWMPVEYIWNWQFVLVSYSLRLLCNHICNCAWVFGFHRISPKEDDAKLNITSKRNPALHWITDWKCHPGDAFWRFSFKNRNKETTNL